MCVYAADVAPDVVPRRFPGLLLLASLLLTRQVGPAGEPSVAMAAVAVAKVAIGRGRHDYVMRAVVVKSRSSRSHRSAGGF